MSRECHCRDFPSVIELRSSALPGIVVFNLKLSDCIRFKMGGGLLGRRELEMPADGVSERFELFVVLFEEFECRVNAVEQVLLSHLRFCCVRVESGLLLRFK